VRQYGTFLALLLACIATIMVHLYRQQLEDTRAAYDELEAKHKAPVPVSIWRDNSGRLWLRVGKAQTEITRACSVRT
jgi:hypothetical protein